MLTVRLLIVTSLPFHRVYRSLIKLTEKNIDVLQANFIKVINLASVFSLRTASSHFFKAVVYEYIIYRVCSKFDSF